MNKYFFVLGRNSTLSIAEIISVLNLQNVNFSMELISSEIAVCKTNQDLKSDELIKTLGGTVKLGKILDEISFDETETKFYKIFSAENLLGRYFPQREGKMHFGVSLYNAGGDSQLLSQLEKQQKDIDLTVKDNFKKEDIKAGFVQIKDRFLSSVSVAKNKLITQGAEIVLILTPEKILIGKTLAVQEFEEFSLRDYFRPAKDKRSGIMPPKLARIMINLAKLGKNDTLLDPFCGSGTILQEAILLGIKNIIGNDISNKAITDTQKNIDWLFEKFSRFKRSDFNLKIIQNDAKILSEKLSSNSIDAIVTEPYLGPPMFRQPDLKEVERLLSELNRLYVKAFSQFAKILKSKGKIVIIFPAFEISGKYYFLPILDAIIALGFQQEHFFSEELREHPAISLTSRNSILYGGKEQFVKREIISYVFLPG